MKKLFLLIVSMATLCCCTEQNLPNNSEGSNEETKDTKDTTNINGGDEQYVETYRLDGYETYSNNTAFYKNVLFYNAESIIDSTYAYSGRNNQWIPSSKCVYSKNTKNNDSREIEYDWYLYQEDVWVLYQHHKNIISNNKVQKWQIDVWHNKWERYQESIYSYNSHGDMTLIENYFYDDNYSYNTWKYDYYYTDDRKDSLYLYSKDSLNQTNYKPINKTIYNRYDAQNNIEEETSSGYQDWQGTTQYSENHKYIRVYDSHRNIIKEEYYSWQDNQWKLFSTKNYERTYIDGTDYQSRCIYYDVYENGHGTFKYETINYYTKVKVKANVAKRLMKPIVQEPAKNIPLVIK